MKQTAITKQPNHNKHIDERHGLFGKYGGRHVPDFLAEALKEVEKEFFRAEKDESFAREYLKLMKNYVGRPSPLYFARKTSEKLGNRIYFKREDLNHTGAHKINNTIGQALLAKRMGMKKVIAETGAGQHGVATATAAALLNLQCEIFMGKRDAEKQKMNVFRMKLLGAKVNIVTQGKATLKEAVDSALEYFAANKDTFYLLGSQVGPHPYPIMVRHFQKIIGEEARKQILETEGKLPDYIIACIGGGSNAIGIMHAFRNDNVRFIGVEPAGKGLGTGKHAATLTRGRPGIIHGFRCYLLQNEKGEPAQTHSIASGLDYPGVSPEHSFLKDIKRARYETATDDEVLTAFHLTSREEGIIPALETAHALAYMYKLGSRVKGKTIIVNFSGRGDKDVEFVAERGGNHE